MLHKDLAPNIIPFPSSCHVKEALTIESDMEVVSLLRPVIYIAEVCLLSFVAIYSEPPI
jgi:hypothetical protein